jgi:hypothetical protein
MKGVEKPKHHPKPEVRAKRILTRRNLIATAAVVFLLAGAVAAYMYFRTTSRSKFLSPTPPAADRHAAGDQKPSPVKPASGAQASSRDSKEANKAFQKIFDQTRGNQDDLAGNLRSWREFLSRYGNSPHASEAKEQIRLIEEDMIAQASEKFKAASAEAELAAAKGNYFAAAKLLEGFKNDPYPPVMKTEAGLKTASYTRSYEDVFHKARAAYNKSLSESLYGQATKAFEDFLANAGDGPRTAEARSCIQAVSKTVEESFAASSTVVHDLLDHFQFVDAASEARSLQGKLAGTIAASRARTLADRVADLQTLHENVVKRIGKGEEPRILPFNVPNLDKAKVVGATPERISLAYRDIQQDLLWTGFSKDEVLQIYALFVEEQRLLQAFAAEFQIKGPYYQ